MKRLKIISVAKNIAKNTAKNIAKSVAGKPPIWIAFLCVFIILALVVVGIIHLAAYFREDITVSASGHQNLAFRVFYLENDIFDENPMPPNLNFLISYTDYIEIDSSFTASFSEEMQIYYSYHAEKRFVIRYMGALTGDLNGIVFEEVIPLSETRGELVSDRLDFNRGTYTVFPKDHIGLYFEFVEDQLRQMAEENVVAQGLRGFSADLLIDFTHIIQAPGFGLNEVVTQGYRIPLTTEIYTLSMTGRSNFDWAGNVAGSGATITLPRVVIFVAVFALSVFGLLYTIKLMRSDCDKKRREADSILKKYSSEIVIYENPVDLEKYKTMTVPDFNELLKLVINLNKHIMCYRDKTQTQFVTIVDGYACLYTINYD